MQKLTHQSKGAWQGFNRAGILMLVLVLVANVSLAKSFWQDDKKDTTGQDKFKDLPLKGERTLEFNTKEGTWLALDLSPDGKTIIFDMLGDLYTMPFAGGKATRLTNGMAFDSQPRYTLDSSERSAPLVRPTYSHRLHH